MLEQLPMVKIELGNATVKIVNGRTMTAEEWADIAIDKIIHVADTAIPEVREPALAFKNKVWAILVEYIRKAVQEEKSWARYQAELVKKEK